MAASSYKGGPVMNHNNGIGRGIVVDNSKGNTNDSTSSDGSNYGIGFMIIGMFHNSCQYQ